MKLKPLGDRLIVKAIEEEETTASGILLPDTAKEKPQRGKVLAVGEGRYDDTVRSASRSTSPKGTRSSTPSTAALRSPSTATTYWSCASPTCSPRSPNQPSQNQTEEQTHGSQGAQVRPGRAHRAPGGR